METVSVLHFLIKKYVQDTQIKSPISKRSRLHRNTKIRLETTVIKDRARRTRPAPALGSHDLLHPRKREFSVLCRTYYVPGTLLGQENAVLGRQTRHLPGQPSVLMWLGQRNCIVFMAQPSQCRTRGKESKTNSRSHHG